MTRTIDRILILGTFKVGSLENYFVNGFVRQGIKVETCNTEYDYKNSYSKVIGKIAPKHLLKSINEETIKTCRQSKSDVIFVCKGMSLFPQTIQEIKQTTKLIVNYNPDHPYKFYSKGSGNKFVKDSLKSYDVFFSYSKKIAKDVCGNYNPNAHCVPFGFDQDTVDKFAPLFGNTASNLFLFFGAWDKTRAEFINNIERNDLEIFGDPEWRTKTRTKKLIQQNYRDAKLYGAQLYEKIRADIGVVNLLREQNLVEGSHNMRTFEVPGYGGLLMSQYTEEQASFFTPDIEAIYFNSSDELSDKMKYLKDNPGKVEKIKLNARGRSISGRYSYDNRCKEMVDILNKYI